MSFKQVALGFLIAGAFASGTYAAEEAQNHPEQSYASPKKRTAFERLKFSVALTSRMFLKGIKLGLLAAIPPTVMTILLAEKARHLMPSFEFNRLIVYPAAYGAWATTLGTWGALLGLATGLTASAVLDEAQQI